MYILIVKWLYVHYEERCMPGMGSGRGMGKGGGQGRNNGGAFGRGGFCVCAECGAKTTHRQGMPCTSVKCPDCGHVMIREELLNR